jgi:DNA polymerase III delta prime subunit
VVVKNPADFVGAALGQSEQNTKGILASAIGKVLVIDEAYGLYGGGDNQGSSSDPYKTAVIDTIVAEVQSVPGDDRCVLLLGYKDQMEMMFQNVNPGLSRRFPIASGFEFDDFTQDELRTILDLKLKQQGYQVTDQAAQVAMEMLDRARNRPNFGNAGEIDILLDATKARHQRRISRNKTRKEPKSTGSNTLLEARDFDENFDRAERAETNIRVLFHDTVGSEQIVGLLEGYQETVRRLKALEMDPKENIPFNFLFRGPPGTGKTTTAKKMGKVFYDMGFLATAEVQECSATDLIGQYVGQTGPKVQKLLDKALGRVLFVDEAYRLAEGQFAKEAMDELVDSVTKPRYHKKLIIILAGYDKDINRLMSVNAGLTSRFPAVIDFRSLTPEECVSLLLKLLQKQRGSLRSKNKDFDLNCLQSPTATFGKQAVSYFKDLAAQENWGSARDVHSIAREIFNKTLLSKTSSAQGKLVLDEEIVKAEFETMLNERRSRAESAVPKLPGPLEELLRQQSAAPAPPKMTHSHATTIKAQAQTQDTAEEEAAPEEQTATAPEKEKQDSRHLHDAKRDAGVSDEVWEQLQKDREAEVEREEEYQRLKERARKASTGAKEAITRLLIEEEMRRREEEEKQKKLAALGVCPMGYNWIKQDAGYRCAGGSHFLSAAELEKL